MSEEWDEYVKDSRTVCKYGIKCYQKNPEHHKKYKHPPQLKAKPTKIQKNNRFQPYNKAKNVNTQPKDTDSIQETVEELKKIKEDVDNQPSGSSNTDKEVKVEEKEMEQEIPEVIVKSDNISFNDKNADHSILKDCFLVEMPEDFFKFYECLSNDSDDVEKLLASVNLQLIGPFELFLGKLPKLEDKDLYLIHWRFFYDPPEFQSVLKKKGNSELHIGYYRDDPKEKPVFLAKNDSSTGYVLTPVSENIFGAVYHYLQAEKKTSPFISIACQKLMEKVKKWAEQNSYSIEEFNHKKRNSQTVCKTFHGAGIVVPYEKKTQLGYRKLVETDSNLKKMFKQLQSAKSEAEKDKILSDLQPVLTCASIAMDECDFGTGLEAGIALFCSGLKELQTSALNNFEVAYSLLRRNVFTKIIKMHIKYRRRGPNMSVLGKE